jgi:hypothetical protein
MNDIDTSLYNNLGFELVNNVIKTPIKASIKLTDLEHKLENNEKCGEVYKPDIHMISRQLFITELYFLNEVVKYTSTIKSYVIYAGGSPGYHLYELSKYYPNIVFIIIDTNPCVLYELVPISKTQYIKKEIHKSPYVHYVKNIDNIQRILKSNVKFYIINKPCTTDLLIKLNIVLFSRNPVYLWSNVGTNLSDYEILDNIVMHYDWMKNIKSKMNMIKLDVPFYNTKIHSIQKHINNIKINTELELLTNYTKHKMLYPNGELLIQPWVSKSSTQSKMIIKDVYDLVIYDISEYDALFNYYNCIERPLRKHNNGKEFYEYGYCECNDCAIELNVLQVYLRNNSDHIINEFKIPPQYNIIGIISNRLECLVGIKLGIHNINLLPPQPEVL